MCVLRHHVILATCLPHTCTYVRTLARTLAIKRKTSPGTHHACPLLVWVCVMVRPYERSCGLVVLANMAVQAIDQCLWCVRTHTGSVSVLGTGFRV
jgi:hypothetical protein